MTESTEKLFGLDDGYSSVYEAKQKYRTLTAHQIMEMDIPVPRRILGDWLKEGTLNMVHAYRGIGKTQLAMSIAAAAASGSDLFSWNAGDPTPMLYVDGELPGWILKLRISEAVARVPNFPQNNLRVFSHFDMMNNSKLMPNLADAEGQAIIEDLLGDAQLLVLDSLATLFRGAGDPNSAESWENNQPWLLSLRQRGIAVLLVHHDGKSGSQRGTSAKEDVLDSVIQLVRSDEAESPEDGCAAELRFLKNRFCVGDSVAPLTIQLETIDGVPSWRYDRIESKTERARRLKQEGFTQKQIGETIGITQSAVSKLLQKGEHTNIPC